QNRPGYVRSLGASRRDTPAYVYDSNTRIKSAFKCGDAESLIPEEVECKREEKNVEKLKSKSRKERRKCKEAANKKPEVSKQSFRKKIVRGRHNLIPRALPTHEISGENVATTAGGYGSGDILYYDPVLLFCNVGPCFQN
ncbi:unnamed protein product, partial [Porites lobata]